MLLTAFIHADWGFALLFYPLQAYGTVVLATRTILFLALLFAPYWVYCAGKMTAFFVHLSCTFFFHLHILCHKILSWHPRIQAQHQRNFYFLRKKKQKQKKPGCRKFRATCESMQKYADLHSAAFLYSTGWSSPRKSERTVAWNINTPTPTWTASNNMQRWFLGPFS